MTYATQQDLLDRFGATELAQLTDPSGAGVIDTVKVTRAIADADAEIDARLAPRYTLPLAYVPAVLVRVAADLTRYFLWDVRASDQVRQRYKDAIALLQGVADGQVDLPGAEELPAAANAVQVAVRAPARLFSDDMLGAFGGHIV